MNQDTGVSAGGDSSDDKKIKQVLSIPSRDSISAIQIGTVLNALGITGTMLRSLSEVEDDEDGNPPRQAMTGECKLALESTLIHTCSRLESLMKDETRWKIRDQDTLEGAQRKLIKEQINFSKAQTALSKSIDTPHYERRPQMAQLGSLWLAIEGDPRNLLNCIVGVGNSPKEAVEAFDHFYNTGNHTDLTNEFMLAYSREHDLKEASEATKRAEPTAPFEESDATTPLPKPRNPNRPKQ